MMTDSTAIHTIGIIICTVGAIVIGIFAFHVMRDLWLCLCDWLRIKRFVWMYSRGACITEQQLEDLAFGEADRWWRHHEHERIWCRFDDYREGMLAASKALLRQRGIHIVKSGKRRTSAPPDAQEKGN